jgi:hypothetical protein
MCVLVQLPAAAAAAAAVTTTTTTTTTTTAQPRDHPDFNAEVDRVHALVVEAVQDLYDRCVSAGKQRCRFTLSAC